MLQNLECCTFTLTNGIIVKFYDGAFTGVILVSDGRVKWFCELISGLMVGFFFLFTI
jgi:hypothetical protein